MRRVAIVGTAGSGKSTLRRQLAARLDVPELELDAIHHLPGWEPIPTEDFRRQVGAFVDGHDGWVVDGNYRAVRDLVWPAADTVVWLDLARPVVMWRVTARSFVRVARREELWNGNRESLRDLLSWDPERSIIRSRRRGGGNGGRRGRPPARGPTAARGGRVPRTCRWARR